MESDVLVRFVAGDLAAAEVTNVFDHLAHCETCRTRVHALRAIAADPDGAWTTFARPDVKTAPAADCLRWATLKVVVDAVRMVASVTIDALAEAAAGAGEWACRPVAASPSVGDASALCRVNPTESRVELGLEGAGIGSVTVVADARRNAVAVILEPPADEAARQRLIARAPRAVLAHDQDLTRHSARLEPVAGASYLLAEFERPEGTDWVLSLEFER